LPHLLLCRLEVLPDPVFSPKAVFPRQGLYLGPVVHDALQRDEAFGAHNPEHLHKEPVQGVLMGYPEVGERVILDRFHAGEPLVGRVIIAEAGDLSRGTNALTVGIDPDAEEQPRVEGRASCPSLYRVDSLIICGEIEMAGKLPDCSHLVIIGDEAFHIDGSLRRSCFRLIVFSRGAGSLCGPASGLAPVMSSMPGSSCMGRLLRVPLDDQGLLVLHDPFDGLPLLHPQRLGKGSRADKVVLLLVIRASSDHLYL
jgi:hypothetical protein